MQLKRIKSRCTFFLIFLVVSFSIFFYTWYENMENKIKTCQSLNDMEASSLLYALDNKKIEIVRKTIEIRAVNLVHGYDECVFNKSRVLSSICNDWNKYLKELVVNKLNQSKFSERLDVQYKDQLQKNINRLNQKCMDRKK